jgi:hypothetical protein
MDRLHGSNHAQLSQAGNILGVKKLDMFDAMA